MEAPAAETLDTYKQMLTADKGNSHRWTLVKGGAMGLAVFGVAQWLMQRNANRDTTQSPQSGSDRDRGGFTR